MCVRVCVCVFVCVQMYSGVAAAWGTDVLPPALKLWTCVGSENGSLSCTCQGFTYGLHCGSLATHRQLCSVQCSATFGTDMFLQSCSCSFYRHVYDRASSPIQIII